MLSRIAVSAALMLIFWLPYYFWKNTWYGADLTANLFAGAIDIVITLVGVDIILSLSDRRRSKPIRYAVYRESRIVLIRIMSLWIEMIKSSSVNFQKLTGPILAEELVTQVGNHFDLGANTNHPHYPSWPFRIESAAQEINNLLSQIFTRYAANIDVELFTCLQDIEGMATLKFMMLSNVVYMTPNSGGAQIKRCFPILEEFQSSDRVTIENFQQVLVKQAKEFEGMPGFHAPRQLTFTDEDIRNDIWPAIRSAYR